MPHIPRRAQIILCEFCEYEELAYVVITRVYDVFSHIDVSCIYLEGSLEWGLGSKGIAHRLVQFAVVRSATFQRRSTIEGASNGFTIGRQRYTCRGTDGRRNI